MKNNVYKSIVHFLLVKVFQRYQPNFTSLLCLKKSLCESTFSRNIVVIVVTFSEDRGIIPNQVELIHVNFLISVLTRTNDIVLRIGRSLTDLPALCTDTVVLYQCCSVSSHQISFIFVINYMSVFKICRVCFGLRLEPVFHTRQHYQNLITFGSWVNELMVATPFLK